MVGIVTTQLLQLQHVIDPSQVYGYYKISKPLGIIFQSAAFVVTMIGAHRFFKQQIAMARGKVWAGGWEVYVIMASTVVVSPA